MTRRAVLDPRTGAAIPLSPAQASAAKAALDALTAERDRARATAVRLEQELAEVTRQRDALAADLDRLRGNVNVLAEVTGALGAQFGPPRQEPQPRLPDPYGTPS